MPKDRGTRTRIAEGVYADAIGLEAVVAVGSGTTKAQKSKRFARGTSMQEIRDWQTATRAALAKKRGKKKAPRQARDTFEADVTRYLKTIESQPSHGSARACLNAWAEHFGARRRATITLADYQSVLDSWYRCEENPNGRYAGSSCAHLKDHLVNLYRVLDACNDDDNVATKLKRYAQAEPEPRAIPDDILDELIGVMRPSRTRACIKVMATFGMPPARQRRLEPKHLNIEKGTVYLVPRRKGKGTKGKTFKLSKDAIEAFKEFVAVKAWGGVTKESIYACFQRAIAAANRIRAKHQRELLPPMRPYDVRHSFGAKVYRKTGDIGAAAELLDVTLETAQRYTLSAVPDRVERAIAALDEEAPRPPAAPEEPRPAQATTRGIRLVAQAGKRL